MRASQYTFKLLSKIAGFLAISTFVLVIIGLILGDDLVLPWYSVPTYINAPFFLEYFQVDGKPFGLLANQILVWKHFATGEYEYLSWLDYLVLGALYVAMVGISVTLTYLHRSWYLICTGVMLLIIMQFNLVELGLPDYSAYISLALFGGLTYFFQSIKTEASLAIRTGSFMLLYILFALAVNLLSPALMPAASSVALGLFTPLMLVALLMIFVGGDTMKVLFDLATKSSTKGKNGLIHFSSIGLIYIMVLILLFLQETGDIELNLWVVNPYVVFMIGLVCGHLSLPAKLQLTKDELPADLITRWLYPALAALALAMMAFAALSGNDSLLRAIELSILGTHLGGAVVFFVYGLINFVPHLLSNEEVKNFFTGFRAPLLTARVLHIIFIVGVFFYLDSQPFYQLRASRYVALGTIAEAEESDLLAAQYYEQASLNDYDNFKGNYSLARLARKEGDYARFVDHMSSARVRENQEKATIALSNYYSDQNLLFSKLLNLKQNPDPTFRVENNLAIAHFEFAHYDSTLMALDRSLDLEASDAAYVNRLALGYYTAIAPPADFPASTDTRINAQAYANKMQERTALNHPLASDTLLYQEELFYLHNQVLNRNKEEAEALLKTYEYYMANPKNTAIKNLMLEGYALQAYDAGLVNKAFERMAELLIIDWKNRPRHAFTLGLWAAQQQAPLLANEYLDMAIQGLYRVQDAVALKEAIAQAAVPEPTRIVLENDPAMPNPEQLATQNAFDISLTLKVISVLKEKGTNAGVIYELMRQAVTVNPYSLKLMENYALASIEAGLASQGRIGLQNLEAKVASEALQQSLATFEAQLQAWRNRPDDF